MKSRITCADRVLAYHTLDATCVERDEVGNDVVKTKRCIDILPNECRMKPVDVYAGKKLKRKFTVKKEGIEERWW